MKIVSCPSYRLDRDVLLRYLKDRAFPTHKYRDLIKVEVCSPADV
jgi:hypothetical protein